MTAVESTQSQSIVSCSRNANSGAGPCRINMRFLMILRLTLFITACALLCSSMNSKAEAQDSITSTGVCSPVFNNIDGNISAKIQCTNNLGGVVQYKFDDNSKAFLAHYFQIDVEAVGNLLDRVNSQNIAPYELTTRLTKIVEEVEYLRAQVASYQNVANAQQLTKQVTLALAKMELERASELFKQLISEFEEVSKKTQSIENVVNVAKANMDLGKLQMASNDYDGAHQSFKNALDWMPGRFEQLILELRVDIAEAALLGSATKDEVNRLIEEAVFYTRNVKDSNSTIYIRALQLQIMSNNSSSNYEKSLDLFRTVLLPLLNKNASAVLDVKNTSLCLSCTAFAAIQLSRYQEAVDITTLAINEFERTLTPKAPELAPLLLNRSIARNNLDDPKEAKADRERALEVALHNAPDGLSPALPYIWINFAQQEDNKDRKKEFYKKAIVAVAQNYPVANTNFDTLLSEAAGADVGIQCFHSPTIEGELGTAEIYQYPFYEFDPRNCEDYLYMGSQLANWHDADFDDLEKRIRKGLATYITDSEVTATSVLGTLGTELIVSGWQDQGRRLTSKQLTIALQNNYRSYQIGETAFRAANFSFQFGYDFGLSDETLYRFAYDTYKQILGAGHEYTQDGAYSLAAFLHHTKRSADLDQFVKEYAAELKATNVDVDPFLAKIAELRGIEPSGGGVPKRTRYASPVD
jgi:hypothetical protein